MSHAAVSHPAHPGVPAAPGTRPLVAAVLAAWFVLVAFLGARACDLAAIGVQDSVFTGTAFVDPDYAARRAQVFVVAVQCTTATSTCAPRDSNSLSAVIAVRRILALNAPHNPRSLVTTATTIRFPSRF